MEKLKCKLIELSWFRGASKSVVLDTSLKNVVVYGSTGSGKSSFVDAFEYVISDGRINHLSHEYSGSRQKDSIINTHIPVDSQSFIKIEFTNNNKIKVEIEKSGKKSIISEPATLLNNIKGWRIENYILRQDELANFIQLTKGEKYSVLLPLLGLEELEKAADNFKKLYRKIKEDSKDEIVENHLNRLNVSIRKYFTDSTDPLIQTRLNNLSLKYSKKYSGDIKTDTNKILAEVNEKIGNLKPESKRHQLLSQCDNEQLQIKLNIFNKSKSNLSEVAGVVIDKKIDVLNATSKYLYSIEKKGEILCPACGQSIEMTAFETHIEKEMSQLKDAREKKEKYETDKKIFYDSFITVLKTLNDNEFKKWMSENGFNNIKDKVEKLLKNEKLENIDFEKEITEITTFIGEQMKVAAPDLSELISDQYVLLSLRTLPAIISLTDYHLRVHSTVTFLAKCESLIQTEIKTKALLKIREITEKIQHLWVKIHPNEPIENVKLYIPEDSDKAIDVSLKFFGVDQPSPRVTLSEGHRNSLGLCIFLALALSQESDDPIILDDIISSLDREHRNRVIDLLKDDLKKRQVILFTHDRDWYIELITLLPEKKWTRLTIKPWVDPVRGIEWSKTSFVFEDARALIPVNPGSAANTVRGIMDSFLAIAAEGLLLELPFKRGESNDKRTAVEFIDRFIGDSVLRFKKADDELAPYNEVVEKLKETRGLLVAYGDPGSHGGEVTQGEAEKTIAACECTWDCFRCKNCGDYVWIADVGKRNTKQCSCGQLRWKYG